MGASKQEILQHEWDKLVRRDGRRIWTEAADQARRASRAYGWWILVAVIFTVVGRLFDPSGALTILVYGVNMLVVLWVATEQVPILPFIPTSKGVHFIAAAIISLLGCVGFLVWLIQSGHTQRACRNIEATIQRLAEDTKASGVNSFQGTITSPPGRALSLEAFEDWKGALDSHLQGLGATNRHANYAPRALEYGYVHGLAPGEFLRNGYKEALHEGEFEWLVGEKAQAGESRVVHPEPPLPTVETRTDEVQPDSPLNTSQRELKPSQEVASVRSELDALFDLFNSGAITVEEFRELRKKI